MIYKSLPLAFLALAGPPLAAAARLPSSRGAPTDSDTQSHCNGAGGLVGALVATCLVSRSVLVHPFPVPPPPARGPRWPVRMWVGYLHFYARLAAVFNFIRP